MASFRDSSYFQAWPQHAARRGGFESCSNPMFLAYLPPFAWYLGLLLPSWLVSERIPLHLKGAALEMCFLGWGGSKGGCRLHSPFICWALETQKRLWEELCCCLSPRELQLADRFSSGSREDRGMKSNLLPYHSVSEGAALAVGWQWSSRSHIQAGGHQYA